MMKGLPNHQMNKIFFLFIDRFLLTHMDNHSISFFGQKNGILLNSTSKTGDFVYFRFLKKKNNGQWEKPSSGEGKSIKFNLGEIIQILEVLSNKRKKWTTVHRYKGDTTSISFTMKERGLLIGIPGYGKLIQFPETKILHDLLLHLYEEKIIFSTGFQTEKHTKSDKAEEKMNKRKTIDYEHQKEDGNNNQGLTFEEIVNRKVHPNPPKEEKADKGTKSDDIPLPSDSGTNPQEWYQSLEKEGEYVLIPGEVISRRGKALSFQVKGLNQIWLPLSQLKDPEYSEMVGGIWSKSWIIQKKLEKIHSIESYI